MKRHCLDMEDKSMSRRSKAPTLSIGNELVAGEESLHVGNPGIGELVQIKVEEGRDADQQVFRYLSTTRTSFHIPEDSGMIPQLRFNPGIILRIMRERKGRKTLKSSFNFAGLIVCCKSKSIRFPLRSTILLRLTNLLIDGFLARD
jgi:hypothetical protein